MPDAPVPEPASSSAATGVRLDREGRWTSHAPLSYGVIGMYLVLMLVIGLIGRSTGPTPIPDPLLFIVIVLAVFLARYVSTTYSMDSDNLYAWRLFGSRTVALREVRKIELANLRNLGSVSFFGGWGWRGRTWSPIAGTFDSVHTMSPGVLVSAGPVPLFVSPKDPQEFAKELSRRVRSYTDAVEVGPGIPGRRPSKTAPA